MSDKLKKFNKSDLQFIYNEALSDYKNKAVPDTLTPQEFVAKCYLEATIVLLERKGYINDEDSLG